MVDLSLIKPTNLWYVVGFITADGNLSSDRRHINFTSKDKELLFQLKRSLKLNNKIGCKYNFKKDISYQIQFGSVQFYRFLMGVGLTPAKSLSLGRLEIPGRYFFDFLRGVIDGDGNISQWVHKTNHTEQWSLRIVSGAKKFILWLKEEIERKSKVRGKFYGYKNNNRKNFIYQIKFGKLAAKIILQKCYYKDCLALNRKFKKATICLQSKNGLSKYGGVIEY